MTFKEFINKLPFTTVTIVYFFVSGGLYLIGYWSTFKFDITSFISLTDIPKSFILPFALTNGFVLLHLFLNFLTTRHYKDKLDEENKEPIKKTKAQRIRALIFSLNTLIMLSFIIAFSLLEKYQLNPTYWSLTTMTIGYMIVYKLSENSHFKNYLPSYSLRTYVSTMLIILPLMCFVTGKYLSLKIFNNDNYLIYEKPVTLNKDDNQSDTLKLVGFIGDKVIISSLDNKRLFIINQSNGQEINLIRK